MQLSGLHHITVLASDPQRNVEFYTEVLGQRLVKQTINFDAPDVYHLYYGDAAGCPGTLMTFFPFPNAARGQRGTGEVSAVGYHAPALSMDFWIHRLSSQGISFDGPNERFGEETLSFLDPDGLRIELIFGANNSPAVAWGRGPVPAQHSLHGFHGVTIVLHDSTDSEKLLSNTLLAVAGPQQGNRRRYSVGEGRFRAIVDVVVRPDLQRSRQSAGSVHHIAWRVHNDADHRAWRDRIVDAGTSVTEVIDRKYFRSIYFREPGGVLYEIATDPPGMAVDEDADLLGSKLQLPPWYEQHRAQIQLALPPLTVKHLSETATKD